ncbi:MAG: BrnA antitoxin family protein [Pseudomonadota bacterium]|nr:BrnA antitoxin family protein [Pseudomonadota bacterium]
MKEHYDFSQGRRGAVVKTNKERITIRLDPDIIQWFRDQVKGGGDSQGLINEALREHIQRRETPLEDTLRRIIREELKAHG